MYVFYNGFKYGQSSGFIFDPIIIVPCSVNVNDTISFGNYFLSITIITIISLVVIIKKRQLLIK